MTFCVFSSRTIRIQFVPEVETSQLEQKHFLKILRKVCISAIKYSKTQRLLKQSHDKRAKEMNFQIGQKVWMFNTRPPRVVPYKLKPNRWQGPYGIKKKLSPAVYVVTRVGEKRSFVVSADRLAKYIEGPNELVWHDVTENEEEVSEDTDNEGTSADEYEVSLSLINAYNIDDRKPQRVRRKPDFYVANEGF